MPDQSRSVLDKTLLLKIYDLMVKSRTLEERMLLIYRKGLAPFWIGSPGEEAFGIPLGLLGLKGRGPEFDYWHLHYRATPTLLALGMDPGDALRLLMNKSTDPSTGGRNFAGHYCFPEWNVLPIFAPIAIQYSIAIGTGVVQKRNKTRGVSIVTGGDAGTAQSDFASSLIWASRPGLELPLYITVQNNRWGISTSFESQHSEEFTSDRGKAFGLETRTYNGNDPEETYLGIQSDLNQIRKTGKPIVAEFSVSRLYGHSSASGGNRVEGEECCIESFERKLVDRGFLAFKNVKKIKGEHFDRIKKLSEIISEEPHPDPNSIWSHTYKETKSANWREF